MKSAGISLAMLSHSKSVMPDKRKRMLDDDPPIDII